MLLCAELFKMALNIYVFTIQQLIILSHKFTEEQLINTLSKELIIGFKLITSKAGSVKQIIE